MFGLRFVFSWKCSFSLCAVLFVLVLSIFVVLILLPVWICLTSGYFLFVVLSFPLFVIRPLVVALMFAWAFEVYVLHFYDIARMLFGAAPRPPNGRPVYRRRNCGAPRESTDPDYHGPEFRLP